MTPCWATLACTDGLEDVEFDGAFINEGPLSWIARDSSKPGRSAPSGSNWLLHASADWSTRHLESTPEEIAPMMLTALEQATGRTLDSVAHCRAHRWRYAMPKKPAESECLWDPTTGLGVCGDWCGGPRIEGAFLSGMAVAGAVLRHYTIDRQACNIRDERAERSLRRAM
jgi:predicted NAD/FAD-dependent oxidoreductase